MDIKAKATLRYAKMSPQKGRLVANEIRGLDVEAALQKLSFMNKKAAKILYKLLQTAISNAEDRNVEDVDSLKISKIKVDGGPVSKRQLPRGRGRVTRILKRSSHVTLGLG